MSKNNAPKDKEKLSTSNGTARPMKESISGIVKPMVENGIFSSDGEGKRECKKIKFKWVC